MVRKVRFTKRESGGVFRFSLYLLVTVNCSVQYPQSSEEPPKVQGGSGFVKSTVSSNKVFVLKNEQLRHVKQIKIHEKKNEVFHATFEEGQNFCKSRASGVFFVLSFSEPERGKTQQLCRPRP